MSRAHKQPAGKPNIRSTDKKRFAYTHEQPVVLEGWQQWWLRLSGIPGYCLASIAWVCLLGFGANTILEQFILSTPDPAEVPVQPAGSSFPLRFFDNLDGPLSGAIGILGMVLVGIIGIALIVAFWYVTWTLIRTAAFYINQGILWLDQESKQYLYKLSFMMLGWLILTLLIILVTDEVLLPLSVAVSALLIGGLSFTIERMLIKKWSVPLATIWQPRPRKAPPRPEA